MMPTEKPIGQITNSRASSSAKTATPTKLSAFSVLSVDKKWVVGGSQCQAF